ncbi:MAG: GNAT family N-acetyltransferase [Bacteriovoracaceae bacterium]|nr:GNAT family N-acetyltransferase [Bacteriovoracaceae bacterium]
MLLNQKKSLNQQDGKAEHDHLKKIFKKYKPKIVFDVESENYTLKTATTFEELLIVFRMRQEIFAPHKKGQENAYYEWDDFDVKADHIIIIDKSNNHICGTYRILCSLDTDSFYSQTEFNMDKFLAIPGIKLELGRACVRPEYRNGTIIGLLWKGLAHFTKTTKAKYLFGCSSVHTIVPKEISEIYQYIQDTAFMEEYGITTRKEFDCPLVPVKSYDLEFIKRMIPPLLRTYMSAGAAVYGQPALDLEFDCVDFLTILNLDEMNTAFKNRFFR